MDIDDIQAHGVNASEILKLRANGICTVAVVFPNYLCFDVTDDKIDPSCYDKEESLED